MDRYMVRPGDTVLRIAKRCGVRAEAIYALNPQLKAEHHLMPGLLLVLPPPPDGPLRYCVLPGDDWACIADRLGVTVDRLAEANPIPEEESLQPGRILELPTEAQSRIVQGGEEYGPRELERDLHALAAAYPFMQVETVGRSVMGKPLYALRLGEGDRRLHVNASFHANEWITSLALMTFIEDYAEAIACGGRIRGSDARRLAGSVQLWAVPMVNPDGVELAIEGLSAAHPHAERLLEWNRYSRRFYRWKANIRGVDLNDQFPAFWEAECARRGTEGPGPRDYPGPRPLSEPEAAAMAAFTELHRFDAVIALHTQGQEIYWNYRDFEPEEAESFAARLGNVSGYRPVKLTGSDAGYKDWFIQTFRKPGMTIEAGHGINPLPLSQAADIYDELAPLLVEAMRHA